MLFLRLNSRSRDLGSPKLAHDAFINSYLKSKFQLSGFYRLLVISKSILIYKNLRTKTKVLRTHAKSQLQSKWLTALLCENYLQTSFTNVIALI